ncbi:MAG: methyltransferase domain-containing protein [Pirellulaceae bacterium]|nr:methyltransferase domain-containing protein [Pirellulaceae bacterium]
MSESQKQTIARYQSFLDAMSLAASLETAARLGVFEALRSGQKDLEVLAQACQLDAEALESLLRVLVAVGAVENYGADFAISQAVGLIASPDRDLGRDIWESLPTYLRGSMSPDHGAVAGNGAAVDLTVARRRAYRERICTRQWSHTAAAMQAAEVLDIGAGLRRLNVLELGSGAGVWSAAMAYRDSDLRVTVVDRAAMLDQCRATYASIDLMDRVTLIEDDYRTWSPPLAQFDLVVLPEVVQLEQDPAAVILLGRAADALRATGQLVILETLREDDGPALPLAIQGLELAVATSGRQRSAAELQRLLIGAGFGLAQWGWLTASSHGIGLVVASLDAP